MSSAAARRCALLDSRGESNGGGAPLPTPVWRLIHTFFFVYLLPTIVYEVLLSRAYPLEPLPKPLPVFSVDSADSPDKTEAYKLARERRLGGSMQEVAEKTGSGHKRPSIFIIADTIPHGIGYMGRCCCCCLAC